MFSEKKAEKTPDVRSRDGHVEHVCKRLEPISQKRREHLDFCVENMCILRSCLKLLGFV